MSYRRYIPEARMTKRLIDIDDELLDRARESLGTEGITDTVRGALREAIAVAARRRHVLWLEKGGMSEMADKEHREAVWR
jgi:Arc/MetJ family transcription regulator